jgi:hypothetical protein
MCAPEPAFSHLDCLAAALADSPLIPNMQCPDGSASGPGRIPALPHLVCRVAALTDSPVVWSRRDLLLDHNLIDSVAGVKWPANLTYVSPPPCSG